MALQKIDGSMIGEVDDPRSGFQLIRRAMIHRYFRKHGIEYNPLMAMNHLISICEVRSITPKMIAEFIIGPGALNPQVNEQENRIKQLETLVESMAKASGIDVDKLLNEAKEEPEQPVSFEEMDMASLRKLCTTMGITMERTDSKDNLIEKIKAHGKDTAELDERDPEASTASTSRRAFGISVG